MKVAIVHYWLINWRGGEKVLETLLELYPQADIYTHVYDEQATEGRLKGRPIYTTLISKLPKANKLYQKYLPFMPFALSQLNLTEYDLVISSESGPTKGVITRPDALHICYCHSPLRYAWDMYFDYLETVNRFIRPLMRIAMHYMQAWDQISAARPDVIVANSRFIQKRIAKSYRRKSELIHPPVALEEFYSNDNRQEYFLVLGQLTAYKKADLVVEAFIQSGKQLVVIGGGEQQELLESMASQHSNIQILGRQDWDVCTRYLSEAKALIFPGIEDFGMVPVEALASGAPVIALARGGALDTVVDGVTGILYLEQSVASLNSAVERFCDEAKNFSSETCQHYAEQFSKPNFKQRFTNLVNESQKQLDEDYLL